MLKQLKAKMEKIIAEMEKIEAKCEKEENEAKLEVFKDMLAEKETEFDQAKNEYEKAVKKAERRKMLDEIEAKSEETEDVAEKVENAEKVEVSAKSEHNEQVHDKEHNDAFMEYVCAKDNGEVTLAKIANKKGDNFVRSIKAVDAKGAEGKGINMPAWLRNYVAPMPTLQKNFYGKATSTADVLTSDASGSSSGGGSLVPNIFVPKLAKIPQRIDDIPSRCMVKRAVGGTAYFPKLSQSTDPFGVQVTWGDGSSGTGEGQALTESDPVFSRTAVTTERMGLITYISDKELRVNNVNLNAELAEMYRGAASRALSNAILEGTAYTNAPDGINTAASITAGVATVNRDTADQVSYEDLVNLKFAVDDGFVDEGVYVFSAGSTGAYKYVAGLVDTDGRPVMKADWATGAPARIDGSEFFSTKSNTVDLGERGDVIYGDFSGYALAVDVDNMAIERSDEYQFNKGIVSFRMQLYVGGELLLPTAFSVLYDSATESSSSSS
jgi:HK97 family phage major capsid protein